ncbi:MAG: cupredoxin domain-containing protein [Actinomycetota bacterium]
MLKRLAPVLALVLIMAACGKPQFDIRAGEPEGPTWFPQVVDFEENTGLGLSIASDPDGNPHLAYLEIDEPLKPGEDPPPPDPLAPILPAVGYAHLVGDIWTHSEFAQSKDADKPRDLTAEDETAIAVDAEGGHHVAWTETGKLYYSNDPTGETEPQLVDAVDAAGLSIWADERGTPWIAYYEILSGDELVALVRVATPTGNRWDVETAAEADSSEPYGTGVGPGPDGPIVAYGNTTGTNLAQRQGSFWRSENVDPEGGLGVSMALDADGNPHLAYLTEDGQVRHAHSIGGGPWEISDVGAATAFATTSIALDATGTHHIAWQRDVGIAYANNAGGEFAEVQLPLAAAEGQRPRLATGPEAVYLGWYSPTGTRLQMATYTEDEPLLAVPSPPPAPGGQPSAECAPEGDTITLTAAAFAWDKDCIAVEAGQPFSIEIVNDDSAAHNVGLYVAEAPPAGELIFQTPFSGVPAGASETFDVPAVEEPGENYFQCDIHPAMAGSFIVAGE